MECIFELYTQVSNKALKEASFLVSLLLRGEWGNMDVMKQTFVEDVDIDYGHYWLSHKLIFSVNNAFVKPLI